MSTNIYVSTDQYETGSAGKVTLTGRRASSQEKMNRLISLQLSVSVYSALKKCNLMLKWAHLPVPYTIIGVSGNFQRYKLLSSLNFGQVWILVKSQTDGQKVMHMSHRSTGVLKNHDRSWFAPLHFREVKLLLCSLTWAGIEPMTSSMEVQCLNHQVTTSPIYHYLEISTRPACDNKCQAPNQTSFRQWTIKYYTLVNLYSSY